VADVLSRSPYGVEIFAREDTHLYPPLAVLDYSRTLSALFAEIQPRKLFGSTA
jgi:hypothetical protein